MSVTLSTGGGGSLSLTVWSHDPSRGLCPWSHVPSGGVSVQGRSLSGGVSVQRGPLSKGISVWGSLSRGGGFCLGGVSVQGVASYWNAFLFFLKCQHVHWDR